MRKYPWVILLIIFPLFIGSANKKETPIPDRVNTQNNKDKNDDLMSHTISIKIGGKTFTATLSDNATVTAFKTLLPMTMMMTELNGNEQYADLPVSLPANASRPSSIQTGDLMLYGSRTVVLFYKTFSTTYSYTKIGHVDDPTGLATALDSDHVTMTFSMP